MGWPDLVAPEVAVIAADVHITELIRCINAHQPGLQRPVEDVQRWAYVFEGNLHTSLQSVSHLDLQRLRAVATGVDRIAMMIMMILMIMMMVMREGA